MYRINQSELEKLFRGEVVKFGKRDFQLDEELLKTFGGDEDESQA